MPLGGMGMFLCILPVFLRVGVVSGNKIKPIITSVSCMHQDSCAG